MEINKTERIVAMIGVRSIEEKIRETEVNITKFDEGDWLKDWYRQRLENLKQSYKEKTGRDYS